MQQSRRDFISNSAKAGALTLIAIPAIEQLFATGNTTTIYPGGPRTGFDQTPLAYAYNALEPWIDAETMDIHYNKHAGTYSKNLKEAAAAEKVDPKTSVEEVLSKISNYS